MTTIRPVGETYVRGDVPTGGTPKQEWAWAVAGNDACIVLERDEGQVVIRVLDCGQELLIPEGDLQAEWRRHGVM